MSNKIYLICEYNEASKQSNTVKGFKNEGSALINLKELTINNSTLNNKFYMKELILED